MANPINERRLADSGLSVNCVLPYAANTTSTNFIDLGATTPFPVTSGLVVNIAASIATQANSKNINIALQHCADTNVSNAVNIPVVMAPLVVTGNTSNVVPTQFNISLPPDCKRYIRCTALGEANGGNSNDGTLTVKLLF